MSDASDREPEICVVKRGRVSGPAHDTEDSRIMTMTADPYSATAADVARSPLDQAVHTYLARQDRREHPAGTFDRAGRFYLAETCGPECGSVSSPSRAYPYPEMIHGRSAVHVAGLYEVTRSELLAAARRVRPPRRFQAPALSYKIAAVADDGAYRSLYDPRVRYAIDATTTDPARPGHEGGLYVWESRGAAVAALGSGWMRELVGDAEVVLLTGRVAGRRLTYGDGTVARSMFTPTDVEPLELCPRCHAYCLSAQKAEHDAWMYPMH
jgi:hypothetical protein